MLIASLSTPKIAAGINNLTLRYCFEEEKITGTRFERSQYYVALTKQQFDDFDAWRSAHYSISRRHFKYCLFDLALKTWLKECSKDQWRDVASCVDEDGWVQLTSREATSYYDWRMGKWSRLETELNY